MSWIFKKIKLLKTRKRCLICFHLLDIFIISRHSKLEFNQINSSCRLNSLGSLCIWQCFFSLYKTNPRFSFLQLLSDPCLTTSWTPTMPESTKSSLPTATKTNFPTATKNAKFNLSPRPISPVTSTPVLRHFHPA